jgi:uncharacterized protein (UPF0335 family)
VFVEIFAGLAMSDIGHNSGEPIAADLLKSLVERVERLEAEITELNADKSEVYKEVKSNGLDVKIFRKVIAHERRKDPPTGTRRTPSSTPISAALGMA